MKNNVGGNTSTGSSNNAELDQLKIDYDSLKQENSQLKSQVNQLRADMLTVKQRLGLS